MEEPIDTKKSLAIENFLKVIKEEPDVLEDSTRMALLFIIMRQKEVTVEELRELLNIKGNTIYYHLKKLEDAEIIVVRKEPVPGTNLSRKICSTNRILPGLFSARTVVRQWSWFITVFQHGNEQLFQAVGLVAHAEYFDIAFR